MTSAAPVQAAVDRGLALDLLRRMLAVPSPPYEERALAELLVESMTGLGLDARIDAAGNAIGETGAGERPTVLLVGHLDTAPGVVPVREDGRRLFGRGAADAKGPLAALVLAAAALRDAPGRIVVAGAVEEETPASRGAQHLAATLDPPDALIVGEPSGWSCVTIGYKGKVDVVYRVSRPATHPTNPMPKAAEVAAAFWSDVLSLVEGWDRRGDDRRPGHAAFDRLAVTLVAMRGDLEQAELELCFRTPVGFDTDRLLSLLGELAEHDRHRVPVAGDLVRAPEEEVVVGREPPETSAPEGAGEVERPHDLARGRLARLLRGGGLEPGEPLAGRERRVPRRDVPEGVLERVDVEGAAEPQAGVDVVGALRTRYPCKELQGLLGGRERCRLQLGGRHVVSSLAPVSRCSASVRTRIPLRYSSISMCSSSVWSRRLSPGP